MKKTFCIICVLCIILIDIGNAQTIIRKDSPQHDSTFIIGLSKTDMAILNGDYKEYVSFANNYINGGEPDSLLRDFILYSYVMAEKYGNTLAAYNCFWLLGGFSDIPQDSILTPLLVHLLEIGASCDTSCADIPEIGCAIYLAEWYGGRNNVSVDVLKQEYYNEKAKAMARCRTRRLQNR